MKGVVFNLLEEVTVAELGENAWDNAIADSGVSGAYSALGSYDHGELVALISALAPTLGMDADSTVRWFGCEALGLLANRYPQFFEGHASTTDFLLTLNDIIHPEVRKLYPGAMSPHFDYRVADPGRVVMAYRSSRGLCMFGQGLIEGAARHFGDGAAVSQPSCTRRGDPECVFEVAT
jgi:predicted hydrocarbon binding protein